MGPHEVRCMDITLDKSPGVSSYRVQKRPLPKGAAQSRCTSCARTKLNSNAFALAHSVCSTQRFIGGRGKEGEGPKNKQVSVSVQALMRCLQGNSTDAMEKLRAWTGNPKVKPQASSKKVQGAAPQQVRGNIEPQKLFCEVGGGGGAGW